MLAEQSGSVLDISKTASKAKVSRTSAVRFLEMLEDMLVAARLGSYREAEAADVVSHPKLYFFDVGVLNGVLENFTASGDRRGRLLEHLVYSQIQHSLWASQRRGKIECFRTRHGVEVDFVVTLEDETVWAIEVKAGAIEDSDLSALMKFREYVAPRLRKRLRLVAVSLKEGPRRMKQGVKVLGLNELLREMKL